MAKLHQKGVIVAALLALAALLLLSACSNQNGGEKRGNVTCYNDSDCPPSYNRFCNANGSACLSSIIFRCEAPGTDNSSCVEGGGSLGCSACPNGCVNGSCLPGNLTPDLIVRDIAFQVVDNQSDVKFNVTVSVMNIGTGMAGQSSTSLGMGSTVLSQYPTPQLAPQQSVTLQPPATIVVLRGTISTLTATADAQDNVAESNENNNQLIRTVHGN